MSTTDSTESGETIYNATNTYYFENFDDVEDEEDSKEYLVGKVDIEKEMIL